MVITPTNSFLQIDETELDDQVDHIQVGRGSGGQAGFTIQLNDGRRLCLTLDPTAARQLGEGLAHFAKIAEVRP